MLIFAREAPLGATIVTTVIAWNKLRFAWLGLLLPAAAWKVCGLELINGTAIEGVGGLPLEPYQK